MRGNPLDLKTHILDRMKQAAPFGVWTFSISDRATLSTKRFTG